MWLFGYGSLIWNPGFAYRRREKARLAGWSLRFWQSSEDHRGTPERPGRVATLVPDRQGWVTGALYLLEGDPQEVLAYLDHREKGGYRRERLQVTAAWGQHAALAYIGPTSGEQFVGPEDESHTAQVIASAVGPSGANRDYLLALQRALAEFGERDPHVDRLVAQLAVASRSL